MTRAPIFALLLAFVLASAASAAPAAPPPEDPEGQVVADLVVRAKDGGPAWWKVSSPTATVWVLGVPSALPKGLAWSDIGLDRRLNQSARVILPPVASLGVLDFFGALMLSGKLQVKAPFETTLPPDLASRYLADAAALHQKPDHYDRLKPALAGLLMVNDFRKSAGLDGGQPMNAIKAAASRHHLKATPAANYPGLPMAKTLVAELSDAVNLACLSDGLQEIEAGSARVQSAAQAWAVGDVAGALTAERGFERCLAALPNGADLARRAEADQANAIAAALRAPGNAVAVVELRPLLAQGGVLDRLRAMGFAVKTPGAS